MRLCSFVAAAVLLSASLAARADDMTFNLEGSFGTSDPLSGQVVIDTTTGAVISGDFSVVFDSVTYLFDSASFLSIYYSGADITDANFTDTTGDTSFIFTFPGDLVGYTGGPLCSIASPNNTCDGRLLQTQISIDGASGHSLLEGSASPTPEPSGMALLATGVLGIAGLMRKRRAQAAK